MSDHTPQFGYQAIVFPARSIFWEQFKNPCQSRNEFLSAFNTTAVGFASACNSSPRSMASTCNNRQWLPLSRNGNANCTTTGHKIKSFSYFISEEKARTGCLLIHGTRRKWKCWHISFVQFVLFMTTLCDVVSQISPQTLFKVPLSASMLLGSENND